MVINFYMSHLFDSFTRNKGNGIKQHLIKHICTGRRCKTTDHEPREKKTNKMGDSLIHTLKVKCYRKKCASVRFFFVHSNGNCETDFPRVIQIAYKL